MVGNLGFFLELGGTNNKDISFIRRFELFSLVSVFLFDDGESGEERITATPPRAGPAHKNVVLGTF